MTASESAAARRWVAVFDLDGTLTWRDTLLQFVMSFLRQYPWHIFGFWRLPYALFSYLAQNRDRGLLKSRVIRMAMRGATRTAIDGCAESFANSLRSHHRLRPAALATLEAHRAAGDHLVLLSASPDLYVARIGRLLGFERTVCTEVQWRGDRLDGALKTANRRGAEKSLCLTRLRAQYPELPVVAYGNSASDLDHMRHADRALLVNANAPARALAVQYGIPCANWT